MPTWMGRRRLAVLLAVAAPVLASLALLPLRSWVENTQVALILVGVVVGVAALGTRLAGYLAAVAAAASFNFFFTMPYQRLTIADRSDLGTFLLLLGLGLAVTELAAWGHRRQAAAGREAGFLAGIQAAASAGHSGAGPQTLIRQVADQLKIVLELQDCRYQPGVAGLGRPARLHQDGTVTWQGQRYDVDRHGLPADTDTEVLVERDGRLLGRYLLTPAPSGRPLTLDRRRVAVTLVYQVGSAGS